MKNKKILLPIAIILIIVVVIASLFIGPYNKLVSLDEDVNKAYGNVQTTVQRRADLIPNLVNTVKGYAKHEEETLTNITNARAGIDKAKTPEELANANEELSQSLKSINIMVEAYPDLKANQNFISLQDELAGTENRIAVARTDYNAVVGIYNKKVRSFPTSLLAKFKGFDQKEYFEAKAEAQDAPDVNFD